MNDELAREVQRVMKGAAGFAAEMRAQGIHVGWGREARCVVDGESWPCSHERAAGGSVSGTPK